MIGTAELVLLFVAVAGNVLWVWELAAVALTDSLDRSEKIRWMTLIALTDAAGACAALVYLRWRTLRAKLPIRSPVLDGERVPECV